jgi:hypothetical protein
MGSMRLPVMPPVAPMPARAVPVRHGAGRDAPACLDLGDLSVVVESNLEDWDGFTDVFAGTLEYDDWFTIYAAVRGLQQLNWTENREAQIGDDNTETTTA